MNEAFDFIKKAEFFFVGNTVKQREYIHFENFKTERDFDTFFYGVILEHITEDSYVVPNSDLKFIIKYVTKNCDVIKVKKLKIKENNSIWEYNNFYFQIIDMNEDNILRIYNKEDMRLILEL